MNNGWVKIHRKFEKWEWYTDIPVKVLFLHLILQANHEDQKWQGKEIKRGQCVVGSVKLAEETGLSRQQVRTALDKLKSTGEITTESTNKFTIVTIDNYSLYQACDDAEQPTNQPTDNQQITNKQPTNNQQITTNKNVKNIKNDKNEKKYICTDEVIDYLNAKAGTNYHHSESSRKYIHARLEEGFTVDDCKAVIDKKVNDWKGTKYEEYLRPKTLFAPEKFEGYLNAPARKPKVVPLPDFMKKEEEEDPEFAWLNYDR